MMIFTSYLMANQQNINSIQNIGVKITPKEYIEMNKKTLNYDRTKRELERALNHKSVSLNQKLALYETADRLRINLSNESFKNEEFISLYLSRIEAIQKEEEGSYDLDKFHSFFLKQDEDYLNYFKSLKIDVNKDLKLIPNTVKQGYVKSLREIERKNPNIKVINDFRKLVLDDVNKLIYLHQLPLYCQNMDNLRNYVNVHFIDQFNQYPILTSGYFKVLPSYKVTKKQNLYSPMPLNFIEDRLNKEEIKYNENVLKENRFAIELDDKVNRYLKRYEKNLHNQFIVNKSNLLEQDIEYLIQLAPYLPKNDLNDFKKAIVALIVYNSRMCLY